MDIGREHSGTTEGVIEVENNGFPKLAIGACYLQKREILVILKCGCG